MILDIWGCIPELSSNCPDMTNTSSTYLGIIVGAIIGAIISWWIYNRQKRTSEKQDKMLNRIRDLEQIHHKVLKKIERIEQQHEQSLQSIIELDKKIQKIIMSRENIEDID